MLYHRELIYIYLSALVEVLYHCELTYREYLILEIYLYRFLEPINSFVMTIPMERGNGMLYYYKLNYIYYLF
jgi:hypothetical protein